MSELLHVAVGRSSAVLAAIGRPGVNLAVWRRPSPLAGCDVPIVHVRLEGSPMSVRRRIHGFGLVRDLAEDVDQLVRQFAALAGSGPVLVRLDHIGLQMCPRFHVDAFGLRLICTYAGPATLWVENRSVDRARLIDPRSGNDEIVRDPNAIHALRCGDVALLVGDGKHPQPVSGIVHSSPPVHPGQPRLVLRVEPLELHPDIA